GLLALFGVGEGRRTGVDGAGGDCGQDEVEVHLARNHVETQLRTSRPDQIHLESDDLSLRVLNSLGAYGVFAATDRVPLSWNFWGTMSTSSGLAGGRISSQPSGLPSSSFVTHPVRRRAAVARIAATADRCFG